MMSPEEREDFVTIRNRLDEISKAVDDDDISLDHALDLYDEAVKLGQKASEILEQINASEIAAAQASAASAEAQAGDSHGETHAGADGAVRGDARAGVGDGAQAADSSGVKNSAGSSGVR